MVADTGAGSGATSEAATIEDAAPNAEGWRDSDAVDAELAVLSARGRADD